MIATLVCAALASQPVRPNVVLVLVDDLGWQDTSLAFGLPEKLVGRHFHTPNLEALAKRGVQVDQAYSSCTVCTPTRVALLTGTHPARNHITNWVQTGNDTDGAFPGTKTPDWNKKGLEPGKARTLAEAFRDNGYWTVQIGKAHFGAGGTPGADPTKLGFDRSIAGSAAGHPSSYYGRENFAARRNPGSPPAHNDVPGLEAYHGKDVFLEEALAAEAGKVVSEAARRKQPLFLWFSPYAVHTPIQANKRLLARYRGLDEREAAYATLVESVDNALGTIIAELKRAKQLDNTVILFTSDNGGLSQSSRGGYPNLHNLPLRSGKGSAYEGGTRVPFVVAGPGIASGKSLNSTTVSSADLYPTLANLAGVEVPQHDGESVAPALRSGKDHERARPLVWHYPHHRGSQGPGLDPHSSIRSGDFKAIYFYGTRRWELYNLKVDIGETRDLASTRTDMLRQMAAQLLEELEGMGAQYPTDLTTGNAIKPVAP